MLSDWAWSELVGDQSVWDHVYEIRVELCSQDCILSPGLISDHRSLHNGDIPGITDADHSIYISQSPR